MTEQELPPHGILRLYGAGGAGINIIGSWNDMDGKKAVGTAECQVAYVDTSRSNLPPSIDQSKVYILDNVDGSGKVRSENHIEIARNIRSVVQKHPPGDLNVVAFSASGGSGSVFGPLLISELIDRKAPVVAVVIGSEESNITCSNTRNTLKSLESIAKKKGVPVVIYYQHNARDAKRSMVDIQCRYALAALAMLGSRQNRELDTKDLFNFLNFNKVTSVEPQLALLHVYNKPEEVDQASAPVAIASLLKDPDQASYSIIPEYASVGYPRERIDSFEQLHFVITLDGVQVIYKMIDDRLGEVTKASSARIKRDSIVSDSDEVTDEGLVL